MKILVSKSQWEEIGIKAGWFKAAVAYKGDPCPKCGNLEHSILNPSHPIINECTKCKYQWNPDNEKVKEQLSFTFGATPEKIIKEKTMQQTPSGYPMTIKSQNEWTAIANAVNKGIDAHLEGFTRSKFDHTTGECLIHPEEMTTFLRRLYENGDEESWGLRSAILETLGIEEI